MKTDFLGGPENENIPVHNIVSIFARERASNRPTSSPGGRVSKVLRPVATDKLPNATVVGDLREWFN